LPRAACAAFEASVKRHTFWFKGDGVTTDNQQSQQRRFLANVSTVLCANAEQTEDEYTVVLHSMLDPVRTAINRHVHSAFWVKSVCGDLHSVCYKATPLLDVLVAETPSDEDCTVTDHYSLGCLNAVMDHEMYNLAEGYYFLNMSMSLLARGAAFCREPALDSILKTMSIDLEERMAYHADSHHFEELLASTQEQLCNRADANVTTWQTAYDAMATKMDAAVNVDNPVCMFPEEEFKLIPYVKHNPPDADDLITIFEGNTKVTITAGVEVAAKILRNGSMCTDRISGEWDPESSARIRAKLEAHGLPQSSYPSAANTKVVSPRQTFLAIPTIYHKLALMCNPKESDSNTTHVDVCVDEDLTYSQTCHSESASASVNPIFDLVTSTDMSKCSGEACRQAARAVIAYQTFLGPLTSMRLDTVQVAQGMTMVSPLLDQDTWTFQRSCAALDNIVDTAISMTAELPAIVAGLRAAAPQLDASCIAPSREWPDNVPAFAPIAGEDAEDIGENGCQIRYGPDGWLAQQGMAVAGRVG